MGIFVVLKRKIEKSRYHNRAFQIWLANQSHEEHRQEQWVGTGTLSILLFDHIAKTWWTNRKDIQWRIHPILDNPSFVPLYQRQPASLWWISDIWSIRCLQPSLIWRTRLTFGTRRRWTNRTKTNQQNKPGDWISILLWTRTIQTLVQRNVSKGNPSSNGYIG